MVALNFLFFMGMLLLGNDESEIPIYIVLLGLGSLFEVAPFQRSMSVEVVARTETSREKYLVTNFMRVIREILTGITFVVIGILMEQSTLI